MKTDKKYIDCECSNLRVSYSRFGSGPPLILLHGGWLTGDLNWVGYYRDLAKHFTVIVPDCRGHGDTNNPEGGFTSYGRMAWEIIEFIEALKLDEKPVVMGFSSGAIISLHMSVFEPKLMARQVLLSIHPYVGKSEKYDRGMEEIFVTSSHRRPPKKWHYILRHPLYALALRDAHKQTPWFELLCQSWAMWIKPLELEQSDYDKIICPTLLMTGSRDEFGTIEEAQGITSLIKSAKFVALDGEDHMSIVQKPSLIQSHALAFMRGHDD